MRTHDQLDCYQAIPHLRRYAYCLTGNREAGDALVEECLWKAVKRGVKLQQGGLALTLFKTFHDVHSSRSDSIGSTGSRGTSEKTLREVLALPLDERQALLLVKVIGFTTAETADIVGTSQDIIERRVMSSLVRLAGSGHSALIIEDEWLVAMEIKRILTDLGFKRAEIAASHEKAVLAMRDFVPDIVLADVYLGEGKSGIDTVSAIASGGAHHVVYVTAYPEKIAEAPPELRAPIVPKPFTAKQIVDAVEGALGTVSPLASPS